jgi:hypothetical protein
LVRNGSGDARIMEGIVRVRCVLERDSDGIRGYDDENE